MRRARAAGVEPGPVRPCTGKHRLHSRPAVDGGDPRSRQVDWTSPDRPGYRYRGCSPAPALHDLVQAKRARGEELSDADRRFIGYLVAARRWPEGPTPNASGAPSCAPARAATDELNWAQRLMLWRRSRGLVPMDMPQDEQTRNVIAYLRSEPFRAQLVRACLRARGTVDGLLDGPTGLRPARGRPGAGLPAHRRLQRPGDTIQLPA